ncbi:hypothetical protein R1flu_001228 [Riccia fluitans]|uniref:Uncharacterized protein n=1 Tax=Riccia fluitans TaxID=41844 RepID=A0ABD1Y2Q0_9MARC
MPLGIIDVHLVEDALTLFKFQARLVRVAFSGKVSGRLLSWKHRGKLILQFRLPPLQPLQHFLSKEFL